MTARSSARSRNLRRTMKPTQVRTDSQLHHDGSSYARKPMVESLALSTKASRGNTGLEYLLLFL